MNGFLMTMQRRPRQSYLACVSCHGVVWIDAGIKQQYFDVRRLPKKLLHRHALLFGTIPSPATSFVMLHYKWSTVMLIPTDNLLRSLMPWAEFCWLILQLSNWFECGKASRGIVLLGIDATTAVEGQNRHILATIQTQQVSFLHIVIRSRRRGVTWCQDWGMIVPGHLSS